MLLPSVIAAVGLGVALVAALQARAGRLSVGHGTAWAMAGIALLAAGVLLGLFWRRHAGLTAGGAVALGLALAVALAFGLAHAITLSRLNERVKSLAQEIALLHETRERREGADPAAAEDAAHRAD
jgi:hypothetical protein